jgi:hypothetical protein
MRSTLLPERRKINIVRLTGTARQRTDRSPFRILLGKISFQTINLGFEMLLLLARWQVAEIIFSFISLYTKTARVTFTAQTHNKQRKPRTYVGMTDVYNNAYAMSISGQSNVRSQIPF